MKLTKSDFHRIDHHWVAGAEGVHIAVEPSEFGFSLVVYGRLADIPDPEAKIRVDPTGPQWKKLVDEANAIVTGLRIAKDKDEHTRLL